MTNTPEYIREQLELYLRGELDSVQASQVAESININPAWKQIHRQLLIEQQGIRLNHLKFNRQSLLDLEATLTNQEKKIHSEGDLSVHSSLSHRPNDSEGQKVKTEARDMEEETINPENQHGIRYSNLRSLLSELKEEEKKRDGTASPSKSLSTGRGMRRIWIGTIAASLAIFLIITNKLFELNKPKFTNSYFLEHFDEFILHDKIRSSNQIENLDKDKEIGYDLFVLKEFQSAIPFLKKRWENNKDSIALYYLIISYAELGNVQYKQYINKELTQYPYLSDKINKLIK